MAVKAQTNEFRATGRRKTSVARVRLAHGVGKTSVNGKPLEDYFKSDSLIRFINQPFNATQTANQYDIMARISGGGPVGQAGALRHGISRALVMADENLKQSLKDSGCLTRDSRMKERKKPGRPGARKRFQFSKR